MKHLRAGLIAGLVAAIGWIVLNVGLFALSLVEDGIGPSSSLPPSMIWLVRRLLSITEWLTDIQDKLFKGDAVTGLDDYLAFVILQALAIGMAIGAGWMLCTAIARRIATQRNG